MDQAHNESKVAELLYETFSLFDLDGSGCMDSVEFEQVHQSSYTSILGDT